MKVTAIRVRSATGRYPADAAAAATSGGSEKAGTRYATAIMNKPDKDLG